MSEEYNTPETSAAWKIFIQTGNEEELFEIIARLEKERAALRAKLEEEQDDNMEWRKIAQRRADKLGRCREAFVAGCYRYRQGLGDDLAHVSDRDIAAIERWADEYAVIAEIWRAGG